MKTLIRNGRVIDPASGHDGVADLLIENGVVVAVDHGIEAEGARVLEAEGLVAGAMKEGKLTPAQAPWARDFAASDPEGFEAFVAKAPVVLPLHEGAAAALPSSGRASVAVLDEVQREVNRAMGISDELFAKHNIARR